MLRTTSIIGLTVGMLLAGCSSTKKQVADQPVAAPDSGIPKKRVDPPTVSARNAKSETSKALAMAARPKIDQLIGLDEASLRLVLGEPAAVEDTAPSKLWVYKRHQCTMNVTLYPDVETKKFHALNYEVNGNDGSARQQQCTTQFSSQLAALPSG